MISQRNQCCFAFIFWENVASKTKNKIPWHIRFVTLDANVSLLRNPNLLTRMYLFPGCDPIAVISFTDILDKATEKIFIPPPFNRRVTFSTGSGHSSLLLQELSVNKTKAFA